MTQLLKLHRLPTVQQVVTLVGHLRETKIAVIGDLHPIGSCALLRRDDDDTVRTLRTIDGGSRGIFQHLHRLNIIGIDGTNIHIRHTIHHDQRVGTVQRADTTDTDRRLTTGTSRVGDIDTRCLSLQSLRESRYRLLMNRLRRDHSHRAGDVFLGLCAVTDYHHLIQVLCVFHQLDLNIAL